MALNYSTFDAGFNIVTTDFGQLDSRYFRIAENFNELSSSAAIDDIAKSISASRNIFGSGSSYRTTDCTIVTSGSGNLLKFNNVTNSFSTNKWEGAIIYDTSAVGMFYSDASNWVKLIDTKGGSIINGNLSLSSSFPVYSLTGSIGAEIAITNVDGTSVFRISSSLNESTIYHTKNIIFKTGASPIGEISTVGNLTFISGSVNLGSIS